MLSFYEIDDREIDAYGPRLWDADPTVCCAAHQLGACRHTEDYEPSEEELAADEAEHQAQMASDPDYATAVLRAQRLAVRPCPPAFDADEEPF
jgi:hypothetical protein